MQTTTTGIALRLSHPCGSCQRPVALRTLSNTAACTACGHHTALPDTTWRTLVDRATVATLLTGDPEHSEGPLSRRLPRCGDCQRPVALEGLPSAVVVGGLRCACGADTPVRAADALARSLISGASYTIGEKPPVATDNPILFACMGCGGALMADGQRRVEDCGRCKASNYLPDALWAALHPVSDTVEICVVTRLFEEERLSLSLESEPASRLLAMRSTLTEALCRALLIHDAPTVRATLATNPTVPSHTLARLAEDTEISVRSALAQSATLPPDTRTLLLLDAAAAVRQALATNPTTPPLDLARLAGDPDSGVRQAVAQARQTPDEALVAMVALEPDERVLAALLSRAELPDAVLCALAQGELRPGLARRIAAWPTLPDPAAHHLASHYEDAVRLALLSRESLPEDALRTLVADARPEIRQQARAHPDYTAARKRRRRTTLMFSSAVLLVSGAGGLVGALLLAAQFSDELMRLVP